MSITNELRNFAIAGMSAIECAAYSDELIAIADRIDAEYQKVLNERFNTLVDARDKSINTVT